MFGGRGMTVFLFLKQIVDMFYKEEALIYALIIFATVLFFGQVIVVKPSIRKHLTLSDGMVVVLALQIMLIYNRAPGDYFAFVKIISAFMMFFLGRVYYDRINEAAGALVIAGYIVIYGNLLWKFIHFGIDVFNISSKDGYMYYDDTDMAIALIIAMTFIILYGHNTGFKYVTAFIVCPLMIFTSDAGIQKILMLVALAIICMYILELLVEKPRVANLVLTAALIILLLAIFIIHLPAFGVISEDFVVTVFGGKIVDNNNMYGRYDVWRKVVELYNSYDLNSKLFGISFDTGSQTLSLYVNMLYSLGMVGIIMGLMMIGNIFYYVVRVSDRKTFYVCVIMLMLLLGTGVVTNSMEYIQMSWFPMMYAGMVVSSVQVGEE